MNFKAVGSIREGGYTRFIGSFDKRPLLVVGSEIEIELGENLIKGKFCGFEADSPLDGEILVKCTEIGYRGV